MIQPTPAYERLTYVDCGDRPQRRLGTASRPRAARTFVLAGRRLRPVGAPTTYGIGVALKQRCGGAVRILPEHRGIVLPAGRRLRTGLIPRSSRAVAIADNSNAHTRLRHACEPYAKYVVPGLFAVAYITSTQRSGA